MLCPECGASITDGFASCPWCGTPLTPGASSPIAAHPTDEDAFVAPLFRFPPLTIAILLINVGMYFLMERHGGSEDQLTLLLFGAKLRAAISSGDYWRLLTANFLHIGPWHLLLNSITLIQLGMVCENIYGRARFVLLYLLTGMGGFIASALLSDTLSAGASAALFGLMGATLTFGWRHGREIPPALRPHFTWYLLPWVVVMIAFGLFYGGIDNWAHIGGLASGVALALVLRNRILDSIRPAPRLPVALALTGLLVFTVDSVWRAATSIESGLAITAAKGSAAPNGRIELMTRFIDANPGSGLYYHLRGQAQLSADRIPEAEEDFRQALFHGFDAPTAKNDLAWLIITHDGATQPRINEAVKLAREAVQEERDPAFLNTMGWALYLRGDTVPAITQLEAAYRSHADRPDSGRILDLYMLTLAYQRKGDAAQAKRKFDAAEHLRQELKTPDPEVERFGALASAAILEPSR